MDEQDDIPFTLEELQGMKGLYSDFWDKKRLTDHALFLDKLPDNIQDDPTLVALQQISEEELRSGEDIMKHWRQVGNDLYKDALAFEAENNAEMKKRRLQDALSAYEKALEAEVDDVEQRSNIHSNRATVFYKLGLYSNAVDEAKRGIVHNHLNSKAYFHAARSCLAMGLHKRALSFIEEAERQLPEVLMKPLLPIKAQLEKTIARRAQNAKEGELEKERKFQHLTKVLAARQINWKAESCYDAPLDDPEITANNLIAWPILLLVDEYNASEGVGAVEESAPIKAIVEHVFSQSLAWDKEGKYQPDNVRLAVWTGVNEDYVDIPDLSKPLFSVLSHCNVVHRYLVFKVFV